MDDAAGVKKLCPHDWSRRAEGKGCGVWRWISPGHMPMWWFLLSGLLPGVIAAIVVTVW